MASINSFADIMLDWEGLIAAVKERAELEKAVDSEMRALEKDLTEARKLKARQEVHAAGRQELTQQIKELVAHGKAVAISIRAVAKGKIGYRNEGLVLFNVAPVRSRPRRPAVIVPPEVEPEVEDTQPSGD